METPIRDNISKIIENNNLKYDGISKSDLTSLTLYQVFQKKYFNNNYANSFILKDYDNALWNTTGNMSTVALTGISGVISSPDKESDYDSQFAWGDYSSLLIKKSDFNKIKRIYTAFKESKSFEEISSNIQDIANKDRESLFLFQSLLQNEVSTNDFYSQVMNGVSLEYNKSEIYKNSIPCNQIGEINKVSSSNDITKLEFAKSKYELLNKVNKRIQSFKNLDALFDKYKDQIEKIIENVEKLHPEINHKPIANNLKFYIIETKQSSKGYFNKDVFKAVDKDKRIIKNISSCQDFYEQDESFIDFIYDNPLSYSKYNRSLINQIEGLTYIADDLLTPNDYGNQFFLVAKTAKGETVGTLSLDKSNSYKHLFKITGVCVKNSFRGLGVAKQIYQKLADISIDNNMIIHNNNYSPIGRTHLPKMKMKILEENPLFVMIDESLIDSIPDKKVNNALEAYNKHSLRKIKEMEMNKSTNIKDTINAYLAGKKLILKQTNKPTEISYEKLCNYGLEVFVSKLEDKSRVKNKNNKKSP